MTAIPPRIRQALYIGYALLGVALSVAAVYGLDVADHITALGVIGAAFGFTAAANVTPPTPPASRPARRRPAA